MSIPQEPLPAQLVLSILSSKWHCFWSDLAIQLRERFGPEDYISDYIAFRETTYYDLELETPIYRRIVGFSTLIPPEKLTGIKLYTNYLENHHQLEDGRRIFNLDPGLLFLERLVLASGKNHTHRIYLGQGIWGDLTLLFQKGDWQCLPWTYPDYAGKEVQKVLTELRRIYKAKLIQEGLLKKSPK